MRLAGVGDQALDRNTPGRLITVRGFARRPVGLASGRVAFPEVTFVPRSTDAPKRSTL